MPAQRATVTAASTWLLLGTCCVCVGWGHFCISHSQIHTGVSCVVRVEPLAPLSWPGISDLSSAISSLFLASRCEPDALLRACAFVCAYVLVCVLCSAEAFRRAPPPHRTISFPRTRPPFLASGHEPVAVVAQGLRQVEPADGTLHPYPQRLLSAQATSARLHQVRLPLLLLPPPLTRDTCLCFQDPTCPSLCSHGSSNVGSSNRSLHSQN
jgi:hypothetical protein